MSDSHPPIFRSAMRAFFVMVFGTVGFIFTILLIVLFFGLFGEDELDMNMKTTILPNADGVREILSDSSPAILQLDIQGIIGTEKLSMGTIRQALVESREGELEDDRVKGLLLMINTGGGTVIDSDGIYRAIKEYKARYDVPVIAYIDGICASGGMYIAVAADRIYASDTSVIGSVGVLLPPFLNFSKLMETWGIESKSITAGKDKDAMNPLRPWKKDEAENFKEITDYFYDRFVDLVITNRPMMSREALIQKYGARVFPAAVAKEYGYIDEVVNTREDALQQLVRHAGLEGEEYQVVGMESKNWVSELFESSNHLLRGEVTHRLQLDGEVPPELMNQFLYLYQPGR